MILATTQDVSDRLRRELTDTETDLAPILLEEASVLVEAYLRRRGITYSDLSQVPRTVVIVVSRIAARAMTTTIPDVQENAISMQAGADFSIRYQDPLSSGVVLLAADKRWLHNIIPGYQSASFGSDRYGS